MKKLLAIFMFTALLVFGYASSVQAEGEIDIFPYDLESCLIPEDCPLQIGDSNWDAVYNGYRYHIPGGQARYAVDFDDDNSDGFITADEMPTNSWDSFGGLIINDTASEVVIKTMNTTRSDLTGAFHGIWAYFDETGELQMFEAFVTFQFMIFNDGTSEAPDWRLATQAEIDDYEAADPKPDTTKLSYIRIALDDTDSDGYVVEPIGYLSWVKEGIDTSSAPVAEWSDILADDPNNVTIPAGWSTVSFGTLERNGSNQKSIDFIKTLPYALAAGDTAPAVIEYTDQPGWFSGLVGYDADPVTPGVNMIVDYNSTFDLPTDIHAQWLKMFDTSGNIINDLENLDYSVEISDESGVLETIDFTWDGTEYSASAALTSLDTSVFGSGVIAKYMFTTPSGDLTEVMVDIAVGVLPPKFIGVEDVYINEKTYVDLLDGITADDGYGNPVTNTVEITKPDNLNTYSPEPGEYMIDLLFTVEVLIPGVDSSVTIDGTTTDWDDAFLDSSTSLLSSSAEYHIFTDETMVHDVAWGFGTVLVLVGADGLVDAVYDRYTWDVTDETGEWNDGGSTFETWKASVVIEDGGFVIGSYGGTISPALRDLAYNDPVSYTVETEDQLFYVDTEASYTLTVDDITAPVAIVLDDNYTIETGEFATANAAILANVVAFDNYDAPDDLAVYVSNNDGLLPDTAGTYTVEVTVEDVAGNSAMVTFDVEIVAAPVMYTAAEVDSMIADAIADQDLFTATEAQALIDAAIADQDLFTQEEADQLIEDAINAQDLFTEAEAQELVDQAIEDFAADAGCGSALSIGTVLVMITGVLGAGVLFFIRKH